ncbi:MAG: PhzF family phenazine biosynthesis protein [Anaerolineales bacterium]
MEVLRIAAFSDNNKGGNPAGVAICDEMPGEEEMLAIAKQVGYSETAFLTRVEDGWRVRYFAPEMEVPFCGHATIASGAVLGEKFGEGVYKLFINQGEITVSASKSDKGAFIAALQSPRTWSETAPNDYVKKILAEFDLTAADLDTNYPVRFAFAGAKHLIVVLKERKKLAEISYHFERVKALMQQEDLVTIDMLWVESPHRFHSRNLFPTGGVYEDPATGAAAAALAGYLRDIEWQGENRFEILQGEDMGSPSRLIVEFTMNKGESIKVSGETRHITEATAAD